ncbi:NACHT domain-containing protein [Amycolatopsis minnesotensis]|uniref:NACHT domain-containing protein n=1 Tax=Amycolatopsis minnesotensis TaxID=337894 RepID=A0ABP5E0Z2_9PSEU
MPTSNAKGQLGWLAAILVPPGATAGLWSGWVHEHSVLAVVLLILYEGVLAVLSFAKGVWSELLERWRARLVDRIDQSLGRKLVRFDRRYREFVLGTLRFVDLKGLATIGPYAPQLDEVFVEPWLVPRSPHQVMSDPLADVPAGLTERSSLGDRLDRPSPSVLAVVGAAGSGKTTLLRHTARKICRTRGKRRRTVPIFLFLRDHAAEILATPEVALADLQRGTLGRYRADEPRGWFEQKLRDGSCVVLLDGLDEVPAPADRRSISDWVERQIGQYPGNDYVITSRPHGYRAAAITGATVFQVRRFTDEQVARFVRGWYRSIERQTTGVDAGELETRAVSAADDLLDRLRNSAALRELTVNPLLLTMIANVHHYRSALPGSRAELYSEICEVMLWRRHSAKRLPVELGGDQKELLLRQLAFTMMERRVRDFPRSGVLAALEPMLRRVSKDLTAEAFLTGVGASGLLVERENGLYSFAHHTFQEHLAAAHIQDKGPSGLLPGCVDDEWWRECTLLYSARADADPIIRACLVSGSVIALALAFDCAQHAREIDPALRDRLDRLLHSSYDAGTDPRRRRLMARVMVNRHLRDLTPAAGAARICVQPITVDIYWLFLADTGTERPDDPRPFVPGTGGPVVGVRPADVLGFIRWVNEITGGEPGYRLPSRAEIEDPAVRRALGQPAEPPGSLSVWVRPAGPGAPELWTAEGDPHPHTIPSRVLVQHVTQDLHGSATTLARWLVIRSLVLLRSVSFNLDHGVASARAHDLTGDLVRGLAGAAKLARAGDPVLARRLDSATARAADLARAVGREVDRAHALDLARLRDLGRLHTLNNTLALDLSLGRPFDAARNRGADKESGLVHDLDRSLSRDFDYARRLADALGKDLDRALELDLDRELDIVLGLDLARDAERDPAPSAEFERQFTRLTGPAPAGALAQALHESQGWETADWHRFQGAFARAFVAAVGIGTTDRVVPPGSLGVEVQRACEDVLAGAGPAEGRLGEVVVRLERLAMPVFGRERELTAGAATAIRTAALCLAAEAETVAASRSAAAFRRVAAGVSLLELRRSSQSPATETIVLASA